MTEGSHKQLVNLRLPPVQKNIIYTKTGSQSVNQAIILNYPAAAIYLLRNINWNINYKPFLVINHFTCNGELIAAAVYKFNYVQSINEVSFAWAYKTTRNPSYPPEVIQ